MCVVVFGQVNMSLIVHDSEARRCVEALHQTFFEGGDPLSTTEMGEEDLQPISPA
jgi:hypothetical protein